jgi:hypothetical protein
MNPVCVSTWSGIGQKHFASFLATARKHGIEPQNADENYWPGTDWSNKEWFRKSEAQARFVRENIGRYSHFMFTDSYDIVFAAGWAEIMEKYRKIDSPIVFAAECCPWPKAEQAALYPQVPFRCRYLNAGFWMGEGKAVLALLEDIEKVAAKREQCDQGIAVDTFLSQRHPIALDNACSLCFCCNLDSLDHLDLSGDRPKTKDTGEQPCMFHGNGNSPLINVIMALDRVPRYIATPEEIERMAQ